MFKLIISPQARRELKSIPKQHQHYIRLLLRELRDDPTIGKPLTRELSRRFSLRVGLYRIIYKVNFADKIVSVISAGHRSKVYN